MAADMIVCYGVVPVHCFFYYFLLECKRMTRSCYMMLDINQVLIGIFQTQFSD